MRDPRVDPIPGDVVQRNGVKRTVTDVWSYLALVGRVEFMCEKRGECQDSVCASLPLAGWRRRTDGARIIKRGDDPVAVTSEDRDALRKAIWDVIEESTKHWINRYMEAHDALAELCSAVIGVIETQELENE